MTTLFEVLLKAFVDYVREDDPSEGSFALDYRRTPLGGPPLVVGLARFQSYRARTEAALVQELYDWVESENIGVINFKVLQDDTVILW